MSNRRPQECFRILHGLTKVMYMLALTMVYI
jgi:hypothetical protein